MQKGPFTNGPDVRAKPFGLLDVAMEMLEFLSRRSTFLSTVVPHTGTPRVWHTQQSPDSFTSERAFHVSVYNYKCSYFPKTLPEWNKLPKDIINQQTIDNFKQLLHNLFNSNVHY